MKVTISGITLKDEKTIHLLVAGDANPKEFEDTIDKWALQDLDEIIEMNR